MGIPIPGKMVFILRQGPASGTNVFKYFRMVELLFPTFAALPWLILYYYGWQLKCPCLSSLIPSIGVIFQTMPTLSIINTLRPRQNGRHFTDDISTCIFVNKSVWNLIKISLRFFAKGPINNMKALVQIKAWRRPGDKPLSEPMLVSLLTHKCITRPERVNPGVVASCLKVSLMITHPQNKVSTSQCFIMQNYTSIWLIS